MWLRHRNWVRAGANLAAIDCVNQITWHRKYNQQLSMEHNIAIIVIPHGLKS